MAADLRHRALIEFLIRKRIWEQDLEDKSDSLFQLYLIPFVRCIVCRRGDCRARQLETGIQRPQSRFHLRQITAIRYGSLERIRVSYQSETQSCRSWLCLVIFVLEDEKLENK